MKRLLRNLYVRLFDPMSPGATIEYRPTQAPEYVEQPFELADVIAAASAITRENQKVEAKLYDQAENELAALDAALAGFGLVFELILIEHRSPRRLELAGA